MPHLGEELKQWRKANNKDQAEMADYLGIGYRTYQAIEASGIVKKISDLNKIQSKTALNTQIITESGDDHLKKAIANITESNKVLAESNRELVLMLKQRINSAGTGEAFQSSQVETLEQNDPEERNPKFLDTKENDLIKIKSQKRGTSP